jgi:hypothetical protein
LVRVDRAAKAFRLESWSASVDPRGPGAAPFAGWPVTVPFSAA